MSDGRRKKCNQLITMTDKQPDRQTNGHTCEYYLHNIIHTYSYNSMNKPNWKTQPIILFGDFLFFPENGKG